MEADGPLHYTRSLPHLPLAKTAAKWRCLELRGWRVLSVAQYEWRGLGQDERAEEEYLTTALEGVLWRSGLGGRSASCSEL